MINFFLIKANRNSLEKNIGQESENIPLQERDSFHVSNILYGDDKSSIKQLIAATTLENNKLKSILGIINAKGSGPENRPERRKVNKQFLETLVEEKGCRPLALIWLRKHISLDTISKMLSDEKYIGKILKAIFVWLV